jgi:uncharacterized integral membrane protein (TIGR00697 family)
MHMPRSLFVYSVLYGGLACIAGVLGAKLVALGPLAVEGGIFAFLVLVALAGVVAELHGRDTANRLVVYGFLPLIVSMALIRLVIAMPPADFWAEKQAAYAGLLGQTARMMLAGMIAYGVSQTLNVTIFTAMKRNQGRLLWLRALVASVASQLVDTVLFITIAFWGVEPIELILPGQALAKVILSAVMVPPLIYLLVAVGRRLDARPAVA